MTPEENETVNTLQMALDDLATGQLGIFAAWRLRRRIARDPALAREFAEIQQMQRSLQSLARQNGSHPAQKPASTWTIGGLTMKRRTVLAAVCGLTLFSVSGVFAARTFLYNPFRDLADQKGNLWSGDIYFQGEVKFYDSLNHASGSIGTDTASRKGVTAKVTVSGRDFLLSGAGRHTLRDADGNLLGYAELVPETTEQRAGFWKEHDARLGIDERLSLPHGCNDSYGTAIGFFGKGDDRITWRLTGVAEARFTRADNGHVVMHGKASPVTPALCAKLRHTLNPAAYAATVVEKVPEEPVFEWTVGGKTERRTGSAPLQLPLPDGTVLNVEILPRDPQSSRRNNRPRPLSNYEKQGGVEETLHLSYGAEDGFGTATGYFGDSPNRLTWNLTGTGKICFYRADNEHLVYYGTALLPKLGDSTGASLPVFEWTAGGKTQRHTGLEPFPLTLPDGTRLTARVVPLTPAETAR